MSGVNSKEQGSTRFSSTLDLEKIEEIKKEMNHVIQREYALTREVERLTKAYNGLRGIHEALSISDPTLREFELNERRQSLVRILFENSGEASLASSEPINCEFELQRRQNEFEDNEEESILENVAVVSMVTNDGIDGHILPDRTNSKVPCGSDGRESQSDSSSALSNSNPLGSSRASSINSYGSSLRPRYGGGGRPRQTGDNNRFSAPQGYIEGIIELREKCNELAKNIPEDEVWEDDDEECKEAWLEAKSVVGSGSC